MSLSIDLVSRTGEKHGLINKVANSVKEEDAYKNMKPKDKEEALKRQKEDKRIVTARYLNSRGQNERLTKPYCKYAGDPIETWHFIPGETYQVWKGLVDEVNDPRKRMPKRSDLVGADGVPLTLDGFHEQLHQFVAVGF